MTNGEIALEFEQQASKMDRYGSLLTPPDNFAALLRKAAALLRATTPEPITKKHKDGAMWLLWDGDDWRKCRWNRSWEAWQHSDGGESYESPSQSFTHALPLPPAPEVEP